MPRVEEISVLNRRPASLRRHPFLYQESHGTTLKSAPRASKRSPSLLPPPPWMLEDLAFDLRRPGRRGERRLQLLLQLRAAGVVDAAVVLIPLRPGDQLVEQPGVAVVEGRLAD